MYTEKTKYTLEKLGFEEKEHGVFIDSNESKKVVLGGDGLRCYSIDRGFVDENNDYLEMFLNFVPGDEKGDMKLLENLLKRVFFI